MNKEEVIKKLGESFWNNIIENNSTGCWEWQGSWRVSPEKFSAPRLFYEILLGDIDDGFLVVHSLNGNKCCVNPHHLKLWIPPLSIIKLKRNGRPDKYKAARWRRSNTIKECEFCNSTLNLTTDHIIPLCYSKYFSEFSIDQLAREDNYQVLCKKCNVEKCSFELRLIKRFFNEEQKINIKQEIERYCEEKKCKN